MWNRIAHGLGVTALGVLVACGPSPEEMSELQSQQAAILNKIEDLDKKLDQVARARAPRPSRPQIDANKVYNLPVGSSPFRGPATAKVAIVEFADFQ